MSHILIEEEKPEKVDMTTPLKALTLDYDLLWGGGGGLFSPLFSMGLIGLMIVGGIKRREDRTR